jgi:ribosomal protein L11 methyltransferase
MPDLLTAFGLIAIVLTISALASGLVERAPLSFPMIFLGLGVLLGERGLGFIAVGPHDRTLEAIAVLNLALVLFIDAVRLLSSETGRDWLIPVLVLGPGTLLTIGLVALAAALLLAAGVAGWQAVAATRANAAANGAAVQVRRHDLMRDGPAPGAPTVLANLLRPLLLRVAAEGFAGAAPDALVASGLLAGEGDEVAAAFAAHGLREVARRRDGEWIALLLRR